MGHSWLDIIFRVGRGVSPLLIAAGRKRCKSEYCHIIMFEGLVQPSHLLLVLVVALFMFGPKKLPELGRGLAEAITGFRKGLNEAGQHAIDNGKQDSSKAGS